MKAIQQTSRIALVLATALLSACGSSGVSGAPGTYAQGQDNGQVVTPIDTGGGTSTYPLGFKTVGGSAPVASVPLQTDSLLRVKVTLDPATHNENTPVPTNYTANYSCATVMITLQIEMPKLDANGNPVLVRGQPVLEYKTYDPVVTGRLTALGTSGCAGSQASETINLSHNLFPGHGKLKVTAQAITSNVHCNQSQLFPFNYPVGYYQSNCTGSANPMQSIYQYHVVNGKLQVEVN